MPTICSLCGKPIKHLRAGRTAHITCLEADAGRPAIRWSERRAAGGRECSFCHSTDVRIINGAAFCPDHEPVEKQRPISFAARTFALTTERCPKCGEALTPGVTKGSTKCKCDQPTMPRHLRNNDHDDRPPAQVRYGN